MALRRVAQLTSALSTVVRRQPTSTTTSTVRAVTQQLAPTSVRRANHTATGSQSSTATVEMNLRSNIAHATDHFVCAANQVGDYMGDRGQNAAHPAISAAIDEAEVKLNKLKAQRKELADYLAQKSSPLVPCVQASGALKRPGGP